MVNYKKIVLLLSSITFFNQVILTAEQETNLLDTKISTLKADTDKLKASTDKLQADMDAEETSMHISQASTANLRADMDTLETLFTEQETKLNKMLAMMIQQERLKEHNGEVDPRQAQTEKADLEQQNTEMLSTCGAQVSSAVAAKAAQKENEEYEEKIDALIKSNTAQKKIAQVREKHMIAVYGGLLTLSQFSEETRNIIANMLTPFDNAKRKVTMEENFFLRNLAITEKIFNASYRPTLEQQSKKTGVIVYRDGRRYEQHIYDAIKYKPFGLEKILFLQPCPTFKETAYNHRYLLGLSAAFLGYFGYAAWSWNKGNNFIGQKAFSPLFQYTAKHINNTLNAIGKKIIERPAFTATLAQQAPKLAQESATIMVAEPTSFGRFLGNFAFNIVPKKVTL